MSNEPEHKPPGTEESAFSMTLSRGGRAVLQLRNSAKMEGLFREATSLREGGVVQLSFIISAVFRSYFMWRALVAIVEALVPMTG